MLTGLPVFAAFVVVFAAGLTLVFKPFAVLHARDLRTPWLATIAIVPLAWMAPSVVPGGPSLRLSFACLLVLMFGWPLAIWTLLLIAAIVAAFSGAGVRGAFELAAWHGVVPATFALAVGIAVRRWLPPHVFVYILGRGFFGTVIAAVGAGALATLLRPLPPGTTAPALLVGSWLTAWSEAVITGMLTAIFVAYQPQWLFTWSDRRYLPRPPAGG